MQPVLEVGIGLILAIATLSVVVSSTMELISAAMRLRAKSLEQGIARMLDDQRRVPKGPGSRLGVRRPDRSSPATAAVLSHPLVKALSSARATDRPPSYIDAVTFATALLGSSVEAPELITLGLGAPSEVTAAIGRLPGGDKADVETVWATAKGDVAKFVSAMLAADRGPEILAKLAGDATAVEGRVASAVSDGIPSAAALRIAFDSANASGTFNARSFIDALAEAPSITAVKEAGGDLKSKIGEIKATNPHLGTSLEALLERADNQFNAFRHEIEDWFDREMARVSGWYSRWTQWVMVGVGVALALVLNVSLVTVGKILWQDPTLREAIADLPTQTSAPPTDTTAAEPTESVPAESTPAIVDDSADTSTSPIDASVPSSVPGTDGGSEATDGTEEPEVPSLVELQNRGLPVGWNQTAWPGTDPYLVLHLLGVLMAGVATSFGAPFWFDLLNRFVNLRAAGKPPKPAAETR